MSYRLPSDRDQIMLGVFGNMLACDNLRPCSQAYPPVPCCGPRPNMSRRFSRSGRRSTRRTQRPVRPGAELDRLSVR